jgi:hypothetical protein
MRAVCRMRPRVHTKLVRRPDHRTMLRRAGHRPVGERISPIDNSPEIVAAVASFQEIRRNGNAQKPKSVDVLEHSRGLAMRPFMLLSLTTLSAVALIAVAQFGLHVAPGCQPVTIGHSMVLATCARLDQQPEPTSSPMPTPLAPPREDAIAANRSPSTVGRSTH